MYIYIYIYIYKYSLYFLIKECPPGHCHNMIALWQLVHLATPMYRYMFLTFKTQTKLKLTLEQQG